MISFPHFCQFALCIPSMWPITVKQQMSRFGFIKFVPESPFLLGESTWIHKQFIGSNAHWVPVHLYIWKCDISSQGCSQTDDIWTGNACSESDTDVLFPFGSLGEGRSNGWNVLLKKLYQLKSETGFIWRGIAIKMHIYSVYTESLLIWLFSTSPHSRTHAT